MESLEYLVDLLRDCKENKIKPFQIKFINST